MRLHFVSPQPYILYIYMYVYIMVPAKSQKEPVAASTFGIGAVGVSLFLCSPPWGRAPRCSIIYSSTDLVHPESRNEHSLEQLEKIEHLIHHSDFVQHGLDNTNGQTDAMVAREVKHDTSKSGGPCLHDDNKCERHDIGSMRYCNCKPSVATIFNLRLSISSITWCMQYVD
jgi:hypothetical protein